LLLQHVVGGGTTVVHVQPVKPGAQEEQQLDQTEQSKQASEWAQSVHLQQLNSIKPQPYVPVSQAFTWAMIKAKPNIKRPPWRDMLQVQSAWDFCCLFFSELGTSLKKDSVTKLICIKNFFKLNHVMC
jgi:hypothetical protein